MTSTKQLLSYFNKVPSSLFLPSFSLVLPSSHLSLSLLLLPSPLPLSPISVDLKKNCSAYLVQSGVLMVLPTGFMPIGENKGSSKDIKHSQLSQKYLVIWLLLVDRYITVDEVGFGYGAIVVSCVVVLQTNKFWLLAEIIVCSTAVAIKTIFFVLFVSADARLVLPSHLDPGQCQIIFILVTTKLGNY